MLQLHLSYQQLYCLLRCIIHHIADGYIFGQWLSYFQILKSFHIYIDQDSFISINNYIQTMYIFLLHLCVHQDHWIKTNSNTFFAIQRSIQIFNKCTGLCPISLRELTKVLLIWIILVSHLSKIDHWYFTEWSSPKQTLYEATLYIIVICSQC